MNTPTTPPPARPSEDDVERVARAILAEGEKNELFVHTGYPEDDCTILARAALEAMRPMMAQRAAFDWDVWFDVRNIPIDIRNKLSLHDLKRLGRCAVACTDIAAAETAALERAAQAVLDSDPIMFRHELADAIRALKPTTGRVR